MKHSSCLALILVQMVAQSCAADAQNGMQDTPGTATDVPNSELDPSGRDAREVTQVSAALGSVVRGNNAFALDFYRQASSTQDGNLFISPLSIEAALAIVERGAAGQTAEEFKAALHMGSTRSTSSRCQKPMSPLRARCTSNSSTACVHLPPHPAPPSA